MAVVFIFAVIGMGIGAYVISQKMSAKRLAALQAAATEAGLEFSSIDSANYEPFGFNLFGKGDTREWRNAMWKRDNEMGARVFEYQYTTYSTDSKGNRTSSTTHHTVTLFNVAAQCAHLTIGPENLMTRLADHVGMRDIEFESEEFNKMFNVKCPDRRFASALCDAQMMQWLMTHAGKNHFELNGEFGIAYTTKLAPTELPSVLNFGHQFMAQIPAVVSSLFPKLEA